MKRSLLLFVMLSLITIAAPVRGVAQEADWVFTIPLQISSLSSDITEGAAICYVDDEVIDAECASQGLPSQLSNTIQGGMISADQPHTQEFDGLAAAAGQFVGYNTFSLDADGNSPPNITVRVWAHPTASETQKTVTSHWACVLGLKVVGASDFLSVHPDVLAGDFFDVLSARDGTTLQGFAGGALSGG